MDHRSLILTIWIGCHATVYTNVYTIIKEYCMLGKPSYRNEGGTSQSLPKI